MNHHINKHLCVAQGNFPLAPFVFMVGQIISAKYLQQIKRRKTTFNMGNSHKDENSEDIEAR